jgi:hypothetical protein
MGRILTDHIANPANAELKIEVLDQPDQGGACHLYGVTGYRGAALMIGFQNGPIKDAGVNGVTQEVLLAIVIDRLRGFQNGPYKCRENAVALTKCEEALMWLQKRTRDRLARGVEGTLQV